MASTEAMIFTAVSSKQVYHYKYTESPQIISYEIRQALDIVNYVLLSGGICLFGIISNIINMVIFFRQGLNNTINISLFSLAISDFMSLLTLEFTCFCVNPLLTNSGVPWDAPELQYLAGGWGHATFGHIGCWITVYLTAERCLCIVVPLKVKQILTPPRTTMIVVFMYLINIAALLPEYVYVYIGWRFYPEKNVSLLTLAYREDLAHLAGVSFITAAILGAVSFPAIITFTAVLVVTLNRHAKWRNQATRGTKLSEAISKRDFKTVRMVILLAVILIICNTPGILGHAVSFAVPEVTVAGAQANLFFVLWGVCFMFHAINSSVNIFMYYHMSSKYKRLFQEMFTSCIKDSPITVDSSQEGEQGF